MPRMFKRIGVIGLLAIACNQEEPLVEREDQFVAALIQYLVVEQNQDMGGAAAQNVACVSVWTGSKEDPSPTVLRRFRDHEPPVRPGSECQETGEEPITSYMIHVPTGEAATWYEIDMRSANYQDSDAQVRVGYHTAAMNAGSWHCHLMYTGSAWVVEQCGGSATS